MSESNFDISTIASIIGKSIDVKQGIIPHHYFDKMKNWYKFYYLAYKGWPHTLTLPEYVAKYPRETDVMYAARCSRVWPVNFSRAVINKTTTAIWTENVVRELDSTVDFSDFVKNCDLLGTTLDQFMKFCARMTYVHGFHLLLVDALPVDKVRNFVLPLGSAAKRVSFPYITAYNANCIVDWGYDDFRQLQYVLLLESPDEYTYQYGNPMVSMTYRLVTPTAIFLIQQRRTVNKLGETEYVYNITKYKHVLSDYGIMPIHVMVNEDDKRSPFQSTSGISDLCKADQAIVNYISLRDDVFYAQTFGQLIIQANADDDIKELNTGTGTVIRYPPDMNEPSYIAPPPQVVDGLNSGIESAVSQIQRITDQRFSDSGADTSGQSKEWDFHNQEFSIVSMARVCELAENTIWRILSLATKKIKAPSDDLAVASKYGDSFDLKGARQFIDDLTALTLATNLPPTARKIGTWTAITKLLPNLSEDDKKKIDKELKEQAKMEQEMGQIGLSGANPFKLDETIQGYMDNENKGVTKLKKPDNRLVDKSKSADAE